MNKPSTTVVAQVMNLPNMHINELRSLWRKLYDNDPYIHARPFLERRLAYKLQEVAFTQDNPTLVKKNEQRIQAMLDADKQSSKPSYQQLSPGTVLSRYYQGCEYHVTVTDDGQFNFSGRLYSNLSTIAREITGTRWSGPVFFNLRKTTRNKGKKSS